MKRTGLGRGLDALLPADNSLLTTVIRDLPVDEIDPNANQPRRSFQEDALKELAASITEHGILSPILVVENGSRYRIVAGERRYRAARIAGLSTVPCIVRELTSEQQMAAALIENVQRQDLNPIEEASAIQSLMEECSLTQEQVSQKLGKSRPAIANAVRLLSLPDEITALVSSGALSAGHARVLCSLEEKSRQIALAKQAVREGWSVRRLEEEAKSVPAGKTMSRENTALSPELQQLSDAFRNAFGMKVQLQGNEKKGKITFSYSSPQELESIYETLERLDKEELDE